LVVVSGPHRRTFVTPVTDVRDFLDALSSAKDNPAMTLFPLGKVTVKEDAAHALAMAGQDASFFLDKHASGDYGAADREQNEEGLRQGVFVLSEYRTLLGYKILVITFLDKGETAVFCPPVNHIPLPDLAIWRQQGEQPMKHQSGGNGSGRFVIHSQDMGGWVRFFADKQANVPDDFGLYLSLTLTDWFRKHPGLTMRCVVPINRDGFTLELHAWYEAHLFPPTAACPQPLDDKQS
jgi:hypothetical protein